MARAWEATISLTCEVSWMLQGLQLSAPAPDDEMLQAARRWRDTVATARADTVLGLVR